MERLDAQQATLSAADTLFTASCASASAKLVAAKQFAYQNLIKTGLPSKRMEHWKYINFPRFLASDANLIINNSNTSFSSGSDFIKHSSQFIPSDSQLAQLTQHPMANLCVAAAQPSDFYYLEYSKSTTATNQLATIDFRLTPGAAEHKVIYITIKPNTKIELATVFAQLNQTGLNKTNLNQTNLANQKASLGNYVFFIRLEENASCTLYQQQSLNLASAHFKALFIEQHQHSQFNYYQLEQGASLARTDITADFIQPHAECNIYSLLLAKQKQTIDHHNRINHQVGYCTSSETVKTIADEHSTTIFNGKIIMAPGAKQSVTKQSNKNLLLAPTATVNTKPELEIYADDVTAAHGATVGELDEQALFYLQARGLDLAQARELLLDGFRKEILLALPNEQIKQQWEEQL